jgi:hypothetical protein
MVSTVIDENYARMNVLKGRGHILGLDGDSVP